MEKEHKLELFKIFISIILFILGTITNSLYIYILCYIIISYELYINAFKNIKKGEIFDENLLMIIATLGAFYIKSYQEGVLVILLFEIGELLSDIAIYRSKKSITDLMDLRVEEVLLEDKNTIPVEEVQLGDNFIVKPGDRVPLDGIVVEGASYLDTSSITGESTPKKVVEKDNIISGCINRESTLKIKATSTYKTSTAQKIIELMEQEDNKKANTEKWITKFARIYTPIVIILAGLVFIVPSLLGQDMNEWLYKALVFVVTSCPCALVLSVPLGYFCGVGKSSHEGILIKGANTLEELSKIEYILLDKTGTLTEGVMSISKIDTTMKEKEFINLLASAEENSLHPIAQAIKNKNKEKLKKVTNYKEIEGMGISCNIGKKNLLIGNDKLMKKNKIDIPDYKSNNTIVYCAINNKYTGLVEISDTIKKSSYNLTNLKQELIVLSGDNINIVKDVANKLNINNYYGNLLPKDKIDIAEKYKEKGKVMFIGDGINDAPVISKADIGVSLGNIGTDAALEASDVVLMNDDISKIKEAFSIANYTNKKVKQSIIFAIIVKIIILILGLLGMSTILMAVFADVGVTILAILNVLLIFIKKKEV